MSSINIKPPTKNEELRKSSKQIKKLSFRGRIWAFLKYSFKSMLHIFSLHTFTCSKEGAELWQQFYHGKRTISPICPSSEASASPTQKADATSGKVLHFKPTSPPADDPALIDILHPEPSIPPATPPLEPFGPDGPDLFTEENAKDLFAVAHTDLSGSDIGSAANRTNTLQGLVNFFHSSDVPPELRDEESVQTINKELQTCLQYSKYSDSLVDGITFPEAQKLRTQKILQILRKDGSALIPAGYNAYPSGHAILIRFTMHKEGEKEYISGDVINRGEGLNYHIGQTEGHRSRFSSYMLLEKAPLEEIESSNFFSLLHEVMVTHKPEYFSSLPLSENTGFKIEDFYESVLGAWPRSVKSSEDKDQIFTSQYGGSCTLRPFFALFMKRLGKKTAHKLKIEFYVYSLKNFVKNSKDNPEHAPLILSALSRISRKILNLKNKHIISEERAQTLNEEFSAIEKELQHAIKQQASLEISETTDLSPEERSPQSFQLETPPPVSIKQTEETAIDIHNLGEVRTKAYSLIDNSNFIDCKQLIERAIDALPSVDDPSWSSCRMAKVRELNELSSILQKFLTHEGGTLKTTPNIGCYFLKLFAIQLKILASNEDLKPLTAFYQKRAQQLLQNRYLFCPSKPHLVAEAKKSIAFLFHPLNEQDPQTWCRNFFPRQSQKYVLWNVQTFSSLEDLRNDPEMNMLYSLWSKTHKIDSLSDFKKLFDDILGANCDYSTLTDSWCSFFFAFGFHGTVSKDAVLKSNLELKYGTTDLLFNEYLEHCSLNTSSFTTTFTGSLAPLESWMKQYLFRGESSNQNNLLNITKNAGDIEAQEVQEIASITTSDELLTAQMMRYFSSHLHRLKEPRFRALFQALLFRSTIPQKESDEPFTTSLQRLVSGPKETLSSFISFLKMAQNRAHTNNWTDVELFLLRTEGILLSYLPQVESPELLQRQETSFLERVKRAASADDAATQKQVNELLISLLPYWKERSLSKLTTDILPYIQQTASKSTPSSFEHTQIEEDYLEGLEVLKKHAVASQFLPMWLLQDTGVKRYIKNITKTQQISASEYQLTTASNQEFRVQFDGSTVFISRLYEGDWYRYSLTRPFSSDLLPEEHPLSIDGCLRRNISYWYREKEPTKILLIKKGQETPSYQIDEKGLSPVGEKLFFAKVPRYAPLIRRMKALTSNNDLLSWKNESGEITKIELTEFSLSFNRNPQTKKWFSSQHPGFFIDEHQNLPSLSPAEHYLILKNKEGKRIALMPSRQFEHQKTSFFPKKREVEIAPTDSLLSFSIDEETNYLRPKSTSEFLYLTYLALSYQNYEHASMLMKKMEHFAPEFSPSEFSTLHALFPSKEEKMDIHPTALGIRLQLAVKFLNKAPQETRKIYLSHLSKDIVNYLTQINNVFLYRLSAETEKECLQIASEKGGLSQEEQFIVENRLALLTGQAPIERSIERSYTFASSPASKTQLHEEWFSVGTLFDMKGTFENAKPRQIEFFTRPGYNFIANFLYYYDVLQTKESSSPEYKNLLFLLDASKFDPSGPVQVIRNLLLRIKDDRTVPSAQQLKDSINNGTFIQQLKKLYSRYYADAPSLLQQKWSKAKYSSYTHTIKPARSRLLKATQPTLLEKPLPIKPLPSLEHPMKTYARLIEAPQASPAAVIKKPGKDTVQKNITALKELQTLFSSFHSEEPCVQGEYQRVLDGIAIKEKVLQTELTAPPTPSLDKAQIDALKTELSNHQKSYKTELENKEKEILEIAHTYPLDLALQVKGGLLSKLSLRQLILHFGREDDNAILLSNPSLSVEKLQKLKQLIGEYLIIKTHSQQLQRAEKQITHAQSASEQNREGAIEKLFTILQARRCYTPSQHPHLLVFESIFNVLIRDEQFEALQKLTEGTELESTLKKIIIEAKTGFGKSKLLIPLWKFLTTKKGRLTSITLPSALFQELYVHLASILGDAFDQAIIPIHFSRDTGDRIEDLQYINRQLEDAKKHGKCVLVTTSTMHNLAVLKAKEGFFQQHAGAPTEQQRLLASIRKQLCTEVSNFFEESTECLDPRHPHDYAIGKCEPIETTHCSAIEELFEHTLFDATCTRDLLFDFLSRKEGLTPTKEHYEKELLPVLAARIAEHLLHIPPTNKNFTSIVADLQGKPSKESIAYHASLTPEAKKRYAVLQQQLLYYLPQTLCKKVNERYKLDSFRIALPASRGKIVPQSQFTSIDHLVNFTVQGNLKEAFTANNIVSYVDELKKEAMHNADFEESPSYEAYQKLTKDIPGWPSSIYKIKTTDIQKLTDYINSNPRTKLHFIFSYIIPKITIFPQKITSSAHNLVSMLAHSQGGSGTIAESIPTSLQTITDPSATMNTLIALQKKCTDPIATVPVSTVKTETLKAVLDANKDKNVLIDIAGTFRDFISYESAAKEILAQTAVEGVCYFDSLGNPVVLDRHTMKSIPLSESEIDKEKIFWFYGQSDIVGRDAPLPPNSKAVATLNHTTTKDDFLQGVGRLRELFMGQSVSFIAQVDELDTLNKKASKAGGSSYYLKDFFHHLYTTAGEDNGHKNFDSLLLAFTNLIEERFWKKEQTMPLEEAGKLFWKMKNFFISQTQSDPVASLGIEETALTTREALEKIKSNLVKDWERECARDTSLKAVISPEDLKKQCDELISAKLSTLPSSISLHSQEATVSNVEVVQEEVSEQVTEEESVQHLSLPDRPYMRGKTPPTLKKEYSAETFVPIHSRYSQCEDILDSDLLYAESFLTITESSLSHYERMKPATEYLLIEDPSKEGQPGKYQLVLLDIHAAEEIQKQIAADNKKGVKHAKNFYLFGDQGVLAQNSSKSFPDKEPAVFALRLKARPFTGKLHFSKEERAYLKDETHKAFTQKFFDWIASTMTTPWPDYQVSLTRLQETLNLKKEAFDRIVFFEALESGDVASIRTQLQKGASAQLRNAKGIPALSVAAKTGNPQVVQMLIHAGADLNIQDSEGNTPLLTAIANNHTEIVKILLDAGANPNKANAEGFFPISQAAFLDNDDAIEALIEKNATFDFSQNNRLVNYFIQKEKYRNIKDCASRTALITTVQEERCFRIKGILAHKPDLNIQDSTGMTALAWAVQKKILSS